MTLFFNFQLTFFDTSKSERANAVLSFSDKLHAIQDDMGGQWHGVAISCSLTVSVFLHMTLSSSKKM